MFSKEVYEQRRAELLRRLEGESGLAVFIGNEEAPAQYRDNAYKFRQDSTWLYYFGIDAPGFSATLDLDSGEWTLYADDFTLDDIIWMGPTPSVQERAAEVGIARTQPASKLSWEVSSALIARRRIHFVPATRNATAIRLSSLLGMEPSACFSAGKKGCAAASEPLVRAIISQRLVKAPEEIAELDAACALGFEMHSLARDMIRPGVREIEIVAAMERVAAEKGWGISFPTILTQHGEIFHCHSHEAVVEPGRLMVIDAGVESNSHYASDFTRTYPTAGRFSPMQRAVYQIVCDAHEYAFGAVRPGISYLEVHKGAAGIILEGLKALGIVSGDVSEMVEDGIAGLFMPHGLGHNMGLDVHDMEDFGEDLVGYDSDQSRSSQLGLGSLRMARRLVPGNVVTDEPGIYFIPDLVAKWKRSGTDRGRVNYSELEKYLGLGGIRLEDDVLVTPEGARRLGPKRLPATVEEIENCF